MKTLHKRPIVSLVIGTLLFSILIVARLNASQNSWTKVAPEGESFSVLMPTTASESTRRIQATSGWITGRLYSAVGNNKSFLVLAVRKTTSQQSLLATDFQNFIQSIEYSLRNVKQHSFDFEKEGSQGDQQWRQYRLKMKEVVGIVRLLETEKHLYALVVTRADENDGDLLRFFSSFESGTPNTESDASGVVVDRVAYSQSERTLVPRDNDTNIVANELWPRAAPIIGGILNGKAISLPKPEFPLEARGFSGTVEVQILIDENGRVIYAEATEGPDVLKQNSLEAARASRFSPTRLSGQPIKVSGRIVYNFVSQ